MDLLKKNWFLVAALLVILLVLGYLGRHKIKAMLGMSPTGSAVQTSSGALNSAPSENIYTTRTDPAKGSYLADFQGMSLYVFDNDLASGKSTCYDTCATKWPAYSSGAVAETNLPANITVQTRTDGSKQFAYKGRPLYYYAPDQKPGDILGDGIGGVWHLVTP